MQETTDGNLEKHLHEHLGVSTLVINHYRRKNITIFVQKLCYLSLKLQFSSHLFNKIPTSS
jgi:hypothetical protein